MSKVMESFKEYLKTQNHLNIATVTPENTPIVSTVAYASDDQAAVYFLTDIKTRKAQNILKNPNVAYTIDDDVLEWNTVKGIQMTGTAMILKEKEETEAAMQLIMGKFPQFAEMPKDPKMEIVFIKVVPKEAIFSDNTQGFGHRDTLTF